jgi:site-specific DNA recombinase
MREIRAALYARVACATPQTPHAIMSQLEALRDYAVNSGMKIIEEFTDAGYAGLFLDRPGLDRMRDLAEQCGFDVLLTSGPDRLTRNSAWLVLLIEELERRRVRTIFLNSADDPLAKPPAITGAAVEFEAAPATVRGRFSAAETKCSADVGAGGE